MAHTRDPRYVPRVSRLGASFTITLTVVLAAAFGCSSTSGPEASSAAADAGEGGAGKPAVGPADEEYVYVGPSRLSETGLYADFASRTLADGVVSFAPAHPLFSDGEEKARFIQLPAGTKIDTAEMDRWSFPADTKAWKEFRVGGKLVETRMLWKRGSARGIEEWTRVAFVWEPDGSDAIARPEGVKGASDSAHDIPSSEDCRYCHGNVNDVLIGFSAIELSTDGQLLSFAKKGTFTKPPSAEFAVPGSGTVRDTLGYLHGNCGFCHNDEGALQSQSAIRLRLLVDQATPDETGLLTTTINTKMRHTVGDIDRAVVPGQPEKSQLYMRMITLDIGRMPPKGPKLLDPVGSGAVRDWISALPP